MTNKEIIIQTWMNVNKTLAKQHKLAKKVKYDSNKKIDYLLKQ